MTERVWRILDRHLELLEGAVSESTQGSSLKAQGSRLGSNVPVHVHTLAVM